LLIGHRWVTDSLKEMAGPPGGEKTDGPYRVVSMGRARCEVGSGRQAAVQIIANTFPLRLAHRHMFEEKREAVLAIEAAVLPLMPKAKALAA
jgi:hypothetical protein